MSRNAEESRERRWETHAERLEAAVTWEDRNKIAFDFLRAVAGRAHRSAARRASAAQDPAMRAAYLERMESIRSRVTQQLIDLAAEIDREMDTTPVPADPITAARDYAA